MKGNIFKLERIDMYFMYLLFFIMRNYKTLKQYFSIATGKKSVDI